jgi:hypothetical protein
MKVYNVHERRLDASPEMVGVLIDNLAGPDERLWPAGKWPAMEMDQGLKPGARGGHGPVRYRVAEYVPQRRAAFEFENEGLTAGLDGWHFFEVAPRRKGVVLRHVIDADCDFKDWLRWWFAIRPMHNALLEDALDRAQNEVEGRVPRPAKWGIWVWFIRRLAARDAQRRQARAD